MSFSDKFFNNIIFIPHLKPFLWLLYNISFFFLLLMLSVKFYFLK